MCMSKPVDVGSLRVGGYMVIDGEPCHIVDITKSKPGKHGSAKFRIVAIGVVDGQKRPFVQTVDRGGGVAKTQKNKNKVISLVLNSFFSAELLWTPPVPSCSAEAYVENEQYHSPAQRHTCYFQDQVVMQICVADPSAQT